MSAEYRRPAWGLLFAARGLARCSFVIVGLAIASAAPLQGQDTTAIDESPDLATRYQAAEDRLRAGEATPQVWNEILDTLYRLDQPLKALGAARIAAQEYAQHPQVIGRLARAYFRGGYLDEAAKLSDVVTITEPDPALAVTMSRLLDAEGRTRAALEAAMGGLARAADDAELLYQVASLSGRFGRNVEAVQFFQAAARQAEKLEGYPAELIASRAGARSLIYRAAGGELLNKVVATGEMPFEIGGRLALPTVQVALNGHPPVPMLLDLGGGSMLSVDTALAKAAGIDLLGGGSILDITGQTSQTEWALCRRMSLGQCQLTNVATQVYEFKEDELPGVKGVVSAGLFGSKRLIVDFVTRRARVEDSTPAAQSKSDLLHTPMEVRFLSGDTPLVLVQFKDTKVNAIFDIGSPVSCFGIQRMEQLQQPAQIRDTKLGGMSAKISTRIPFRLGRRAFAQSQSIALPFIEKETSSALGVQVGMILGWNVFKEMRMFTIDAPARKIIIDWRPPRKQGLPPSKTSKKAAKTPASPPSTPQ